MRALRGMAQRWSVAASAGAVAFALAAGAAAAEATPRMSPEARPAPHDSGVFRSDPGYDAKPYDVDSQQEIYSGKHAIDEPRPVFEIGRPIYTEVPFDEGINLIGRKNLLHPAFSVFGDWRTALAFNDNKDDEVGLVATRLNLDVDLKLTASERLHAFFRPLDQGGQFSRYEFFGDDREQGDLRTDGNLETLFFEGDVGAIAAGLSDSYVAFDLPVAAGLVPLLFQNGIWIEDAFIGGAVSIPALNSPRLDISNMDITFFGGVDKVTSPAVLDDQGVLADHSVNIAGVAFFAEAQGGYWEGGFGSLIGEDDFSDVGYHSLTLSFTRRYGGWLSNSVRAFWTFGQESALGGGQQTADGVILLVENSLVTSRPLTLVPYFNAWVGRDRPQPLADNTGLLKNTGINFETDDLTGFPRLDDTGHDTFGGALGIQYLFGLDQQIVAEFASVQAIGGAGEPGRAAVNDQYGFGVRYQLPLDKAWILRADAMYGFLVDDDDLGGVRVEIRRKF